MKAIAVHPGKPDSVHLAELPEPSVSEIPNGRGVVVRVLRVGVDGTDKEINAAEYGAAPEGYDFLVLGHEGFGRVEKVGPNVSGEDPLKWDSDMDRIKKIQSRRSVDSTLNTRRMQTEREKAIERKMSTPVTLDFNNTPLRQAMKWKDFEYEPPPSSEED